MLHKAIFLCVFTIFAFILSACSGDEDEIRDFLEPVNLQLESLQLGGGASLEYDGSPVFEFDPNNVGPYKIILDDSEPSTISLTAVYDRPSVPARLSIVEYRQVDENNRPRTTQISSGTAVELELLPGSNNFGVLVQHNDSSARLEYRLELERSANINSADLRNIFVDGVQSTQNTSTLVSFNTEFVSTTRSYDVEVASSLCSVAIDPIPVGSMAQITVDGKSLINGRTYIELEEGVEKSVPVVVTAADGSTTSTYTLDITRRSATESEIQADASLRSLTIAEGRPVVRPFFCSPNIGLINQRIPASVTQINLTAVPSRSAASMRIGRLVAGSGATLTFDDASLEPLEAGVAYTGSLVQNLPFGRTNLGIIVTPPDDDRPTRSYQVAIDRNATNEIFVSTPEALQAALRNAQPNDEIFVEPGDYLGLPSEADSETGSGSPDAHFFSAASGALATEAGELDEFITLTLSRSGVNLIGDDLNQNTVLKIAGDNWRIRGANGSLLRISGAQNGIVLDGANNVVVESVAIDGVGERAVVMTNGASNNQIRGSFINNTGLSPVTRDGIDEVYAEAVVIGGGEGLASANAVRNMVFGRDIEHEVVDIKAGSELSDIQYSAFDLDSVGSTTVAARSVISVNASADISFNLFEYNFISSNPNLPPDLLQNPVQRFIASAPGADERVEVYDNIVQLDGQSLPFVNGAGNGETVAVANFVGNRSDEVSPSYSGNVGLNFSRPSYQIQSTLDASKCLAKRTVTLTPTPSEGATSVELGVMVDCANEPSQLWITLNEGNGFFQIAQASDPSVKLQSAFLGSIFSQTAVTGAVTQRVLRARTDALPSEPSFRNNADFNLRWQISEHLGNVTFINRFGSDTIAENIAVNLTSSTLDSAPVRVLSPLEVPADGSFIFKQVRQ